MIDLDCVQLTPVDYLMDLLHIKSVLECDNSSNASKPVLSRHRSSVLVQTESMLNLLSCTELLVRRDRIILLSSALFTPKASSGQTGKGIHRPVFDVYLSIVHLILNTCCIPEVAISRPKPKSISPSNLPNKCFRKQCLDNDIALLRLIKNSCIGQVHKDFIRMCNTIRGESTSKNGTEILEKSASESESMITEIIDRSIPLVKKM